MEFWEQFWPQFFASITSVIVLTGLGYGIGYFSRHRIARAIHRSLKNIKNSENQ